MKAWYFSNNERTLRFGDNRKIARGVIHTVDCEPVLCEQGLYASEDILDALDYAPGSVVWRVELSGIIAEGYDKVAATKRTYLWGVDAKDVLPEFARRCAIDVISLWDAPPIVTEYLKTGNAARATARAASAAAAAWEASAAARAAIREKQSARLERMVRQCHR